MRLTDRPAPRPASEDAEQAVLACYLLSPQLLDLHPTTPEHYDSERHRAVHGAICRLRDEGIGIDLRTIQAELEAAGHLDLVGGIAYLASLDLALPDLSGCPRYVAILEDRRLKRRLLAEAERLKKVALNGVPALEALDELQGRLTRLAEDACRVEGVTAADVLAELIPQVTTMRHGETIGIPTGIYSLDAKTTGFEPGTVWVVGGRPGNGKSSFAQNVLHHQAFRLKEPSLVFSFEMRRRAVMLRLLGIECQLSARDIGHGHTSDGQRERIRRAGAAMRESPLWIVDPGQMEIDHLVGLARSMYARKKYRVLWVDHMAHIRPGIKARRDSRHEELSDAFHALQALAADLGITAVLLNQLNRSIETRADGIPQLSDLKDCGSAEQVADTVLFVSRPELRVRGATPGLMHLFVAKQREGETGVLPVHFEKTTVTIRDYVHDAMPADAYPK